MAEQQYTGWNEDTFLPLPENLRREYLRALGIDSYLPRMQLPGAPVSEIVDVRTAEPAPAAPAADAPEAGSPPPAPRPAPAAPPETPAPAPVTAAAPVAAEDGKTSAAEPARVTHKEEIRLQLLCIRASDGLAVLNAMPHMGPGRLSARHRALLVNLLKACGIPGADIQVEDKAFCWPMVTGLHVDNSRRAAAAALAAYLQQKQKDWGCNRLLVLGEEVVQRVFTQDGGDTAAGPSLSRGGWQPVYTRSLDEMLQRPALKKEAWARIRTLLD